MTTATEDRRTADRNLILEVACRSLGGWGAFASTLMFMWNIAAIHSLLVMNLTVVALGVFLLILSVGLDMEEGRRSNFPFRNYAGFYRFFGLTTIMGVAFFNLDTIVQFLKWIMS